MQIVEVDCTVPVTCVEFVGASTGLYDVDAWAVYIKRFSPWDGYTGAPKPPMPHWNAGSCCDPCGPGVLWVKTAGPCGIVDTCAPCAEPTIMYKVHEINMAGHVCFHWDELLYSQCPGRYSAVVKDIHGKEIGKFMIALTRRRTYVKSVCSIPSHCC